MPDAQVRSNFANTPSRLMAIPGTDGNGDCGMTPYSRAGHFGLTTSCPSRTVADPTSEGLGLPALNNGAIHLLVELDPDEPRDGFVDYLLRLGCTVTDRGGGAFAVQLRFPETVDDEEAALARWCASWSRTHASSRVVHGSDIDDGHCHPL
jgi:hypothetical protein